MAEIKERLIIHNQTEKPAEIIQKPVEKMVDLQKNREAFVPREVKSWMEIVEEDQFVNQKQQNTDTTDQILQPIATTVSKVTLPTDKYTFSNGFGKSINEAGRWLSEFVFRIIKTNKGKVKFNEE